MNSLQSSYGISERLKVWGVTFLYAIAVIILSGFHEVWRDEVVVLSFVKENNSLVELFSQLKYYGHPGLWHLLLYIGHHIYPHPEILQIVNLTICVFAVFLFLNRSPFNWRQKILFIAGFFPLYLYPTFSRNYALSMLLIFIVAALYKDRWVKFVSLSVALFLLANVHSHSFITAVAVGLALFVELFVLKAYREIPIDKRWKILMGFGIISLGFILFVLQTLPPADSVIFSSRHNSVLDIVKAFVKALIMPGEYFRKIFGVESKILVTVIIFSLYAYLWRKKALLIMFAVGVIGLAMFFQLIYPTGSMRHQGAFYLLMIMMLWMDTFVAPEVKSARGILGVLGDFISRHKQTLVTILLLVEVGMAYPAIKEEIARPYSSGQSFAQWVAATPAVKDAIFLGVPDAALETFPYYLDNPLYFYSEERFGTYRLFKDLGRNDFTLTDVLKDAQRLQAQYHKPVVIVLSQKIREQGPYVRNNYNRTFRYSQEELNVFYEHTDLIADFPEAISDEKYRVYLLKS